MTVLPLPLSLFKPRRMERPDLRELPVRARLAGLLLALMGIFAQPASAQSPAEFFAGKTVRIIVPFDIAGTYGQYAQFAAQHLRSHLPGNPNVIVQVMQGAGGIVALNHVYNIAPKDGTVVIIPAINFVQDALLNPQAKYEVAGFEWLGRLMELVQLGVASEKSGITSVEDAKKRSVSSGGSGTTNPTVMSWRILNLMAGTKFNVVSGYKGLPDSQLAWERSEIDAVMLNWEHVVERHMEAYKAGRIKVLFAYAGRSLPEIAGHPLIGSFGRNPTDNAFLAIYTVGAELGRSFALAKGVPADRVAAWRAAFDGMLADPTMKAEMAKRGMRFDPASGVEIQRLVAKAMDFPPEMLPGIKTIFEQVIAPQ